MIWEASLDRYLTTPFDDGFEDWTEKVGDNLSDAFWEKNEDWFMNDLCTDWLNKIFYKKDLTIEQAAQLIERAHKLYKLQNH